MMLSFIILGAMALSARDSLTEQEISEGWKLLWDGKTAEGWRGARLSTFPEKGWTMENGILKVNPGKGEE